jgi:hypothetical protein
VLRLTLVSVVVLSLLGAAGACNEAPSSIVLGPLPKRPVDLNTEDAGVDIPDGSIACTSDSDCDDGVDCTRDVCLSQGYCSSTTDYTRCSDDVFCNGIEVCDAFKGCVPGVVPTCDDMDPCTIDSCSDEQKSCIHGPRDFDHDGEADVHCAGGTDCDDFDETRGSLRAEICGDAIDNDCDGEIDELDCGQPAHDTCSDALEVTPGGTFEVSLLGAVADYTTTCNMTADGRPDPNRQPGPDVVFTFELTEPRDVKLVGRGILNNGDDETTTLTLQSKCGVLSSEVKCATSFPADLRVRALPAGRYYVVASSQPAAASLWLSLETSPPTAAPTNALCEDAIDVSKGGRFEGDFVDVGDETMSVCGTPKQPDVYYKFTLDKESDVEISAVSDESGMLTIGVRDTCDGASMVRGCRSAEPALTRLHQLQPGSYVIVLEGPSSRELSYALEVAILDPTPIPQGDNCQSPIPLTVGTPVLTSIGDKQAEVRSSCESSGPDVVFSLHLDTVRDVLINADAENAAVFAALQKTCGDVGTERGCSKSMPLELRVHSVEPGDYFVVVDSPEAQSVTVEVMTFDPTPTTPVTGNDTCANAFEIFGSGGIYTGDTRTLLADYSDACGINVASNDAVFKLQLNDRRHVTATLEAGFDAVLHRIRDMRTTPDVCMGVPSEVCNDKTVGGTSALIDDIPSSGVYYYVVDGFGGTNTGFYTFTVSITAP